MSLTSFALERRTVTGTLIVVLIFAGVGAYLDAPRQMDPGFIIRTAMITTYFPGASPERVEQLITDPIEKVVQEIPELDWVNSESRTGVSVIYVNIREEFKEMRPIWDNLRRKVDSVEPNLPEDIQGPFVDDEFGDVYPILFSMTGDGFSYMELKDIADDLRDELLRIKSVAKVDIMGAQEERLFVEYDNAVLSRIGMTPQFLKDTLQQRNIIQPGGEIDVAAETIALEPSGNFASVEELRRTVIRMPATDDLVYLEDIVDIYRGYVDPPEALVRAAGEPALTLAVSMAEGGNLIELGEELQGFFKAHPGAIPARRRVLSDVLSAHEGRSQGQRLRRKRHAGRRHRVGGHAVDARPSNRPRRGDPRPSHDGHHHVGDERFSAFSLDQMSLRGAHHRAWSARRQRHRDLGVDHGPHGRGRRRHRGRSRGYQRASRAPSHCVAHDGCRVPCPFVSPSRAVGEYTGVLFSVVTITLLVSWVLALTMIPLLCVRFLKPKPVEEPFDSKFYQAYRRSIMAVLRHPVLSISVAGVGFVLGIQLFGFVPQIFFPTRYLKLLRRRVHVPSGHLHSNDRVDDQKTWTASSKAS